MLGRWMDNGKGAAGLLPPPRWGARPAAHYSRARGAAVSSSHTGRHRHVPRGSLRRRGLWRLVAPLASLFPALLRLLAALLQCLLQLGREGGVDLALR